MKTNILMGDALGQVTEKFSRAMIITDSFMAEKDIVGYVVQRLREGTDYTVFSDVNTDPDIACVARGVSRLTEYNPDVVVAFGGGSAIDAAKAIVYFARRVGGFGQCPFIAVPTTSGTGSEVSKYAVITDAEKQIKYPIIDEQVLPDIAVLDAQTLQTLPPSVTADTGMDVFTHAIESFTSTQATDFSKGMSRKAIKLVSKYLFAAYKQPDNMRARQSMHNASCIAGIAFSNAGLGLTHSMAHAIGARFHLPHGRANAILLPYVMSFNAGCARSLTDVAKAYGVIAKGMGMEATSVRQSALNLIRTVRNYTGKLDIPTSIKAAGIVREEFTQALSAMSQAAMEDLCTITNPQRCTQQDVMAIYTRAYEGKLP